jgi:inner membrane transporter RhtA
MSTGPAVAAVVGFLVVGEVIELRAIIAILLVMTAAAGVSRFG